jgi:hypothetical protein
MIQEAPQVQKMLKNESSRNRMKPIPLRLARRADSGHIFTSSNRHRMRKLSHSDRFPKQAKSQQSTGKKSMLNHMTSCMIIMLTWHCDTWQSNNMLTGQVADVDHHHLTSVTFTGKLNGATWPRHGLPRGTPSFVGMG